MKKFCLAVLATLALPTALHAQAAQPYRPAANTTDGNPSPVKMMCWEGATSKYKSCPVSDTSALNQLAQIAAEQAIRDRLGDLSGPAVGSTNARLEQLRALLAAPLSTAAKQESVQLASANMATSAQTVYGGTYVLAQLCSSYNSGALVARYRGPDGSTMLTLTSKSASDTGGGTLVSLGSGAVVDVTLPAGSTGCNATLARVP